MKFCVVGGQLREEVIGMGEREYFFRDETRGGEVRDGKEEQNVGECFGWERSELRHFFLMSDVV